MLKRIAVVFAVVSLLALCLLKPGVCQPKADPRAFWLNQATDVTDRLRKEAIQLEPSNRALLYGQLGKLWWDEDRERARSFIKTAVQDVADRPNRETGFEQTKRLTAARALVAIVPLMDQEFNEKLNSILTTDSREQSTEQGNANATALVQAALGILNKDPAKAAALGSTSLKVGRSSQIIYLLSELRTRDLNAADVLFLEVLASAQKSLDADMLAALSRVAFIGPAPSDRTRTAVLVALANDLLNLQNQNNSVDNSCTFASIAAPLLARFQDLLPQEAELVQASVLKCNNRLNSWRETSTGSPSDPKLTSVGDFLRAASETSDKKRKVALMAKAAYLAAQEKNFQQAISILDEFADDEREQLNGGWENWRWEFASSAAIELLKHNDVSPIDKIIYTTPAKLRGFVKIMISDEMANSHHQKVVEFLQDARRDFSNSSEDISVEWYFSLLKRYAKFIPQDAPAVLREVVKAINHADQAEALRAENQTGQPDRSNLEPITLPIPLLETDIAEVRSTLGDIGVTAMRIRLMLGLVNSSLELAGRKPHVTDTLSQR